MSSAQRLLLIDGYSTIFRAFYAIRNLSNSKGEPTNAVYGFVNMLRKILREQNPDLVGIAFDTPSKTFRKERYEEYKANRAPMPDDLRTQMPLVRKAIAGFRIPILEVEGFEADDVLGSLSRQAKQAGYDVVIVTADKDLMQLVGPGVSLLHTGREKLYDAALVAEDFGVPPGQVVDVLALMGDSVDNVPGVPGIGEKGAKTLIREYGSLDNLLEHAPELKRKAYREGLEQHRDQALLSRELVTIDSMVEVAFDPTQLRFEEPDGEALFELYRELEFFSLLEELESEGLTAAKRTYPTACEHKTVSAWDAAVGDFEGTLSVALVPEDAPLGLVVVAGEQDAFADFRRPGLRGAARQSLWRWLAEPSFELVGHDLKEVLRFALEETDFSAAETEDPSAAETDRSAAETDRSAAETDRSAAETDSSASSAAPEVACRLTDTMLLAYLLRSALRYFGLKEVVFERFHHRVLKPEEAGFADGEAPQPGDTRLLRMAGELGRLPLELAEQMSEELAAPLGGEPERVFRDLEEPLMPVLVRMEEAGVLLDIGFLERMSIDLGTELEALEQQIYDLADESFNINSPQQLGLILFEKLGYPVLRRTRKTKKYSTSAEILEELAARGFDLPQLVLRFREYAKLKSTYVDALPALVDSDQRLHTRFQQAVAATGRLSSANPNLQNIPVRSEVGQRIRRAFRAPEGYLLLVADYSQIELRVLAHIAEETALIEAFREGADIHRSTAASVFGIDPSLVSDEQRRAAKTINFGIIYGMSAFGLSQRLGIPTKEARAFIDAYFDRFPQVRAYTEDTLRQVEHDGYVTTLYGRCRFLADIKSRNRNLRENAKRMAINARIQGTAADLLKLAMIAVDRRFRDSWPEARLLLTVHDELVAEAPREQAEEVGAALTEEMEAVAELAVPLRVDLGIGESWLDAKS